MPHQSTPQRCHCFEFHLQISSARTFSGKVLQPMDSGCALTPASAQGRFHTSRCTVAMPSDLACFLLVRHGEESHTGESALLQSKCLFRVQTHPQRSSRRLFFCSGGILVLFNALVVANLSMPAVASMPLMSRLLVPAFFHSARRSPCLIS